MSLWRYMTVTGQASGNGPVPLRPFTFAGLWDAPFNLFRRAARLMLLITAMVVVPVQVLLGYLDAGVLASVDFGDMVTDPQGPERVLDDLLMETADPVNSMLGWVVSLASGIVLMPIVTGLLARVGVSTALGERIGGEQARKATQPKWWALIGATVLTWLIAFVPVFVAAFVGVFLAVLAGPVGVVLFLLVAVMCIAYLAAVYTLLGVAPVILVTEHAPLMQALRRSYDLVKPRFWGYLWVMIVAYVIVWAVMGAVALIPTMVGMFTGGVPGAVAFTFGELLGQMITTPYMALLAVGIFLDARIRREGLDVEIQADTAHGGGLASAR